MTYRLHMPVISNTNNKLPVVKKLFRELLGYTDEEIQQFADSWFMCDVVKNLTLEQAKQITEIFGDNGIQIYLYEQNGESAIFWIDDLGIDLEEHPPKAHYCDEPLVTRNQLVDPSKQQTIEKQKAMARRALNSAPTPTTPTITCPYCKSTNCKKISTLSKAGSAFMWGIFAMGKMSKQWHCNNCGSEF